MHLKRVLSVLITLALAAYIALCVFALFADRVIFQPQRSSYTDTDLARSGEVVKLHSSAPGVTERTITALYLPNPKAKYTLLFSHGNAEDLGDDAPILEMFRDAGFAVFAYDYRGYGTSQSHSTEATVYADADAAYEYLTRNLGVPPARVIAFGRSLGCAAAIHTAAQHPVAALVTEAPFLSAFRVLTRVQLLPWDKFRNLSKIRRIHVPILVIHGRDDRVVPFSQGERIFAEANPPKMNLWVEHAGHNDVLFVAARDYFKALRTFADSLPE